MEHVFPMRYERDHLQRLFLPSELYHENSKITRANWELMRRAEKEPVQRAHMRRYDGTLHTFYEAIQFGSKQYPLSPHVNLPEAPSLLGLDLGKVIRERMSVHQFSGKAMTLQELSSILHFSYGVTRYEDAKNQRFPRRAAPSGGAIYPLEVYTLALDVEGLDWGVYHYEVYSHSLERLATRNPREELDRCLIDQRLNVGTAAAIVVSGLFERPRFKYGELGYRLILLEAGHVGQNICLVTTTLGLGVCPVVGFVEDSINDLLGLDGVEETSIYLFVIGRKREADNHQLQVGEAGS